MLQAQVTAALTNMNLNALKGAHDSMLCNKNTITYQNNTQTL